MANSIAVISPLVQSNLFLCYHTSSEWFLSISSSQDDLLISLEFRQALSISATDSDSESDDESDENDEEVEDGVRGRAEVQGDERSAQLGGVWSWCSVL